MSIRIVAVPSDRPVAKPVVDTETMPCESDVHLADPGVNWTILPFLSYAMNVSCELLPSESVVSSYGKASDVIGVCTTIVAVSLDFFAAAITIVDPILRPETTPLDDTVATEGSVLCHVTADPGSVDDNVSCCCSSMPTSTAR